MMRLVTAVLSLHLLLWLGAFPANAAAPARKILIGGAQSITPLAERFSRQFLKTHPGVEIEIRGSSSNHAVRSVLDAGIDIGLISRKLTPLEKGRLHVVPIGHDAIILLTYPGNPVANVGLDQLRRIYLGRITNWRELGGKNKGIVPLTREHNSALHATFIEHVFGKSFTGGEKAFILRASKEKILRTIKRIEGSLGYGIVRLEDAENQGVKVLAIDGALPTSDNVARGIYPLIRPQLIISRGVRNGAIQEWTLAFARFMEQVATKERP